MRGTVSHDLAPTRHPGTRPSIGMIRVICAAPSVEQPFAIRDRVIETVEYVIEPG
jgi:hypothetical protein